MHVLGQLAAEYALQTLKACPVMLDREPPCSQNRFGPLNLCGEDGRLLGCHRGGQLVQPTGEPVLPAGERVRPETGLRLGMSRQQFVRGVGGQAAAALVQKTCQKRIGLVHR